VIKLEIIGNVLVDVRFTPESGRCADIAGLRIRARLGHQPDLFNHFVGEGEHLGDTCRPSALAVLRFNASSYFGWRLHWQVEVSKKCKSCCGC
jgi:hypothetical protein